MATLSRLVWAVLLPLLLLNLGVVLVAWCFVPPTNVIAYDGYGADRNLDIFIADVRRGVNINLTRHPQDDMIPLWSPDGQKIMFRSQRVDNRWRVFVMAVNGADPRLMSPVRLDNPDYFGLYIPLGWSADSERVVFMQASGPEQRYYSADITTQAVEEIPSDHPDMQDYVNTLADGQVQIENQHLVVGGSPQGWGLYLNGRMILPMTADEVFLDSPPVWSPGRGRVAVTLLHTRDPEIYLLDLSTAALTRVSYSGGQHPTWQPGQ